MDIQSLLNEEFFEEVGADITDEIRLFIKAAGEQITISNPTQTTPKEEPEYFFTTKFHDKANELGLSEADALDVYHFGEQKHDDVIIREYNGYAISIEYELDPSSGKPIISSIRKHSIL